MLPGLKNAVQSQAYDANHQKQVNPYTPYTVFRQSPHNEDAYKCQGKQAAP
ncbi:hypothetical protein F180042I2_04960 [Enterocloster bolteae]